MNNKKTLLAALLLGMAGMAGAQQSYSGTTIETIQESAVKMVADGHFYAAKLSLNRYLDEATLSSRMVKEVEALRLVCDYALRTPGTADVIAAWLDNNPTSPYYDELKTLRCNLLIMEERYEEVNNLEYTPFQYPVSSLQEESKLYCAILDIHDGNYAKAEGLLNELRVNEKYMVDCDYYLSYIKYVKGDFKGAFSGFSAAAVTQKYMNNASLYAADCCVRVNNADQASGFMKNVVESSRNSEDFNRINGEICFGKKKYAEAVSYFEKAGSEDRTALYKQGLSYFFTENYSKAAETLGKSAGINEDVMAQSAWLNAGNAYLKVQKKRQAQMAFLQAAKIDVDKSISEEASYNYALTLHDGATLGFGESVAAFEDFLNTYPKSKYVKTISGHLTEVYFSTKNYSAALASIEKIKQPNNDIRNAKQRVLYNLGIQSFNASDYSGAKSYANRAIAMGEIDNESFSESYFIKGESEYRLGDYKAAASDLVKFTTIAPSDTKNYSYASYSLGYTYFKQQEYVPSLAHFQKYVKNPMTGGAQDALILADAYNRIGDCYMTRRNYNEAFVNYQKSIDVNAANGDYSLFQQAYIAGLKGSYDDKITLLDKMSTVYPSSVYTADALYEKGRAYVQTGNKKSASDAFSKIVESYPQSANARKACNELAMIQYESGDANAAANSYLRVIEDYPNTEEAQTALANLKDVYVSQGKVFEYTSLAAKAGKPLSQTELETMLSEAAVKAVTSNDYVAAQSYYAQLKQQTLSETTRIDAQVGEVRAAFAAKDYTSVISLSSVILDGGSKVSPEVQSEIRMNRIDSYWAKGDLEKAVADLEILSKDEQTVYGAQATVRLAQYYYEAMQYEKAESVLLNFIDSGTPHTYWLARAFVLLSDVCARQGRDIESQQYLLSLKNNYTENEEINKMIEERLK